MTGQFDEQKNLCIELRYAHVRDRDLRSRLQIHSSLNSGLKATKYPNRNWLHRIGGGELIKQLHIQLTVLFKLLLS